MEKPYMSLPNNQQKTQETISNQNKNTIEKDRSKLEFLYFTLNAFDNRRTAIDARTSIVLLFSTTMTVFFASQLAEGGFFYPKNQFLLIFAIFIAALAVVSCIYSLRLISPLKRPKKERKVKQKSLSWCDIVADKTPDDYEREIKELDDAGLVTELSTQAVRISVLLKKRYKLLDNACKIQYVVLCFLFFYIAVVLLFS
jgi:hypothetical protein